MGNENRMTCENGTQERRYSGFRVARNNSLVASSSSSFLLSGERHATCRDETRRDH